MARVMVIGLDGMTLELIERLLPAGVLPAVRACLARGARGELQSVFPTHSAAAWASFMTGLTPAGHGVFDFMERQADGHYRHARPAPGQTLWHLLNRHGLRTGVYNFPITFPPFRVAGWMVSGMLSPALERIAYPAALAGELLARFPRYALDVEWTLYAGHPEALLRDLTALTRLHGEAACYLLQREPVDVFAAAFTTTDRAQHALWRYLDPSHPRYDPDMAARLRPALHTFYGALDEAVARLIEYAGPETTVILLSDHGFQPAAWQFHVDGWLEQHGWLAHLGGSGRLTRWLRRLDTPHVRRLRRRLFRDVSRYMPAFAPGGTIDWARTIAFCPWNAHQGVRLNVRGRDPYGEVAPGAEYERRRAEIAAALEALRHPETGAPVVARVYRADELYRGPYLGAMPDLVFDLQPGYASGQRGLTLFEPTGWTSGDHRLAGLVALCGPEIPAGTLHGARLIDLAPTIMALLGVSPPAALDGQPLLAGTAPARAPVASDCAADQAPPPELSPREEELVLQRLQDLGYL